MEDGRGSKEGHRQQFTINKLKTRDRVRGTAQKGKHFFPTFSHIVHTNAVTVTHCHQSSLANFSRVPGGVQVFFRRGELIFAFFIFVYQEGRVSIKVFFLLQ